MEKILRKTRVALMLILVATAGCAGTDHAQRHPQAQEVLGTVAIAFIPVYSGSLPQPPIDLALRLKEHRTGNSATVDIADGLAIWDQKAPGPPEVGVIFQNFNLLLPSGEYSISGFGVRAKSLSDRMFFLPSGGPKFIVPEDRCFYIGRINADFLRLAPGSMEQAVAAGGNVSASIGRKPLLMIYLPQGALLAWNVVVDLPPEDNRTQANTYSQQVLGYARQKQCMFLLKPNADEESPPSHEQGT